MKHQSWSMSLLLIILFSGFITSDTDIYFKINKSIELFGRVYQETAINYVDNIDPEALMQAGVEGMLSALDPYTVYLDDTHQNDINLITKGKYGGIGATIGVRNDKITVVDLIEGYSAHRQGIIIGDVITEINGKKVGKNNYDEIGTLMKGEPGSTISMIIEREGEKAPITFNLLREEIEVKNVTYFGFIPEESNNAYIKLSGFSRSAGEEIKDAILGLRQTKEIKTIVLDLRGNPGGLLDAAIDVCEKFLSKENLVVSVVGRDTSMIRKYYAQEEPITKNIKLAVLIDNYSASASEIVAGAIQDHDRGVIIGDKSFGKGLVQTIIPLPYNSTLKITTAKYYTPSGRCIQKIDYSEDNDVFSESQKKEENEFLTDTKRVVFARGGIVPDSVVTSDSESDLVKQLLAHGMFFKYVTKLMSETKDSANLITNEKKMYESFIKYLEEQKFDFNFEMDKVLTKLNSLIKERNYNSSMPEKVDELIRVFNSEKMKELDYYRKDLVKEIKLEILNRITGRTGRIRQSLENDEQFETALSILNSEKNYKKLLNLVE